MIVGMGIDVVNVERIDSLCRKYGDRFLLRIFTQNEIGYCMSKHNPPLHFSARFAAKEAASKALGTGFTAGIRFTDIEVLREQGLPHIILHNRALVIAEGLGVCRLHVSLSHDRFQAIAMVIMEDTE